MEVLVSIDRSKPFDPCVFFDEPGWKTVEQDDRAVALVEFNVNIRPSPVQGWTESIGGEDRLQRIRAMRRRIPMDARLLEVLWSDLWSLPSWWGNMDRDGMARTFTLDGTILLSPDGRRCVLSLSYSPIGGWRRGCEYLDTEFGTWYLPVLARV